MQRELDVALEIIQVGHILHQDTVQFVQEPGIFSGHVEGKQVIDIGQHGCAQRAVQLVQVGQRLGGQGETAAVLA